MEVRRGEGKVLAKEEMRLSKLKPNPENSKPDGYY